jgi:Ser/Thr protein kinase RdoA (MazF antagonist)
LYPELPDMLNAVLIAYGISANECNIEPFGAGLIHNTWRVTTKSNTFILQKINHQIFKNPFTISENIQRVSFFLKQNYPEYLFVTPVLSNENKDIVLAPDGYFRLFPFVNQSTTYTSVENPSLAQEAAKQFGKFTHLLSGFDLSTLKITLPDFHNLTLRYHQFEHALLYGNKERLASAFLAVSRVKKYNDIVIKFEKMQRSGLFPQRVIHHDTKISNVLFDKEQRGICVIDLDTLMPGYFISDVGDMMRTYLSVAGEEEKDFSLISVREDYYLAIIEGYLSEMRDDLTEEERKWFVFAGKFMIYMQAIRFLTDYLNNDIYYGAKYEDHNFIRANNQLCLLDRLQEKEQLLLQKTRQSSYI